MRQPLFISKSIGAWIKCEFDKCFWHMRCAIVDAHFWPRTGHLRWPWLFGGLQFVYGMHVGSMLHHGIRVQLVLELQFAQLQQLLHLCANGQDGTGITRILCPKGCQQKILDIITNKGKVILYPHNLLALLRTLMTTPHISSENWKHSPIMHKS